MPLALRLFREKGLLFCGYTSMAFGMATAILAAHFAAFFGAFTVASFSILYASAAAAANLYSFRAGSWRDLRPSCRAHSLVPVLVLLFSIALGLYVRTGDALAHESLAGGPNEYFHYLYVNSVWELGSQGVWTVYPKAFHVVNALVSVFSGVDSHEVLSMLSPILGAGSAIGMYLALSYFGRPWAGAFAALIYAGSPFVRDLVLVSIGPVPPVLSFVLLPLVLILGLEITDDMRTGAVRWRNILGFLGAMTVITLSHPYVGVLVSYIAVLLIPVSLGLHPNLRKATVFLLLCALALSGLLLALGFYAGVKLHSGLDPFVEIKLPGDAQAAPRIGMDNPGGLGFQESTIPDAPRVSPFAHPELILLDFISFKGFYQPPYPLSVIMYVSLVVSGVVAWVGWRRRESWLALVGLAPLLYAFSFSTGILELFYFGQRSGQYYMFTVCLVAGLVIEWLCDPDLAYSFFGRTIACWVPKRFPKLTSTLFQAQPHRLWYRLAALAVLGYTGLLLVAGLRDPASVAWPIILLQAVVALGVLAISYAIPAARATRGQVAAVIALAFVLYTPLPPPPEVYRDFYEEVVPVALSIADRYPLEECAFYSAYPYIRERALVEPWGRFHYLEEVAAWAPGQPVLDAKYSFLFIDKRPFPFQAELMIDSDARKKLIGEEVAANRQRAMRSAVKWMRTYDEVEVYYENDNIAVYLLELSEAVSAYENSTGLGPQVG